MKALMEKLERLLELGGIKKISCFLRSPVLQSFAAC